MTRPATACRATALGLITLGASALGCGEGPATDDQSADATATPLSPHRAAVALCDVILDRDLGSAETPLDRRAAYEKWGACMAKADDAALDRSLAGELLALAAEQNANCRAAADYICLNVALAREGTPPTGDTQAACEAGLERAVAAGIARALYDEGMQPAPVGIPREGCQQAVEDALAAGASEHDAWLEGQKCHLEPARPMNEAASELIASVAEETGIDTETVTKTWTTNWVDLVSTRGLVCDALARGVQDDVAGARCKYESAAFIAPWIVDPNAAVPAP